MNDERIIAACQIKKGFDLSGPLGLGVTGLVLFVLGVCLDHPELIGVGALILFALFLTILLGAITVLLIDAYNYKGP